VERSGIKLGDLNETQRAAALKVLKALLNDEAYAKVTGIMAGDQYLKDNANASDLGNTQYNIAFFGNPSTTNDWSIQFGGHHVGINATFSNGTITFAPTHLGTQPTTYTDSNGQTQSALGDMYQTAFDFYNSLTDEQKQKLYQGEEVKNLICAPGDTCDYPTGTGIKGSELTDEQKQLLLKVIANWTNLADSQTTQATMDQISATLDDTYVNWSGATVYDTSQGKGIYFQISGPKVYIELASQDNDAGATVSGVQTSGWGHIHMIYRDPTNDYAGSVTQQKSSGPTGGGPGGSGSGGPGAGSGGPGGPGAGNGGPSDAPGGSGAPAGAPGGKPGDNESGQTGSNTSKSTSKSATADS
jgi:putative lipoprotein